MDEITESESANLFEILFVNEIKNLEKALITLTAISLSEHTPTLHKFYDEKTIQRLLSVSSVLDGKTAYLAADALRNLLNQAYLMDNTDLVQKIFS
jgi:hypothetical protein